ncbi:Hypothetical predicted protein [Mytilus galloprovincialis]|uniref:Uncharacterized protein n=1 Tax=Mytilus galloprovincialis TaxID=29158 RepID=A0A8B6CZ94_MYTGA|nr:Hypothetical predicted protein [Mytilus galloprovincialis]
MIEKEKKNTVDHMIIAITSIMFDIPSKEHEDLATTVEYHKLSADAFHLFRDYLDYKLVDLKADVASEQDNLSRKFREEVGIKVKKVSIQYHFNDEILTGLYIIQKKGSSLDSPTNSFVSELITKVKARNNSIRIADSSAGGWTTVREYESNTIADNSDDEKKIRQAESRAVKST